MDADMDPYCVGIPVTWIPVDYETKVMRITTMSTINHETGNP